MGEVHRIPYRGPADHPAVTAFVEETEAAREALWAFVESQGGVGYTTSGWDGAIASVYFVRDKTYNGDLWKTVGDDWHDGKPVRERQPKRTKVASELRAAWETLPKMPMARSLAVALGWDAKLTPYEGSARYFGVAHVLELPQRSVTLWLPRVHGDGWVKPDHLTEIYQSEYMDLIAAHNAAVEVADG